MRGYNNNIISPFPSCLHFMFGATNIILRTQADKKFSSNFRIQCIASRRREPPVLLYFLILTQFSLEQEMPTICISSYRKIVLTFTFRMIFVWCWLTALMYVYQVPWWCTFMLWFRLSMRRRQCIIIIILWFFRDAKYKVYPPSSNTPLYKLLQEVYTLYLFIIIKRRHPTAVLKSCEAVMSSAVQERLFYLKKRFCSCFSTIQSPTANYVNEGLKTSFFFYFSSSSSKSRVLNSWILILLRFKSCLNEYEVFITWKESIYVFLFKLYTDNNSNSHNKMGYKNT